MNKLTKFLLKSLLALVIFNAIAGIGVARYMQEQAVAFESMRIANIKVTSVIDPSEWTDPTNDIPTDEFIIGNDYAKDYNFILENEGEVNTTWQLYVDENPLNLPIELYVGNRYMQIRQSFPLNIGSSTNVTVRVWGQVNTLAASSTDNGNTIAIANLRDSRGGIELRFIATQKD